MVFLEPDVRAERAAAVALRRVLGHPPLALVGQHACACRSSLRHVCAETVEVEVEGLPEVGTALETLASAPFKAVPRAWREGECSR